MGQKTKKKNKKILKIEDFGSRLGQMKNGPGPQGKWIDKMIIGRKNDYIGKKYIIIIHKLC